MNFRELIKTLVPPVLIDIYRKQRNKEYTGNLWEGIYPSFREIPITGDGYHGDEWIEAKCRYTENLLRIYKENRSIPVGVSSRYSLLALLVSIYKRHDLVHILDFGGGMGVAYVYLLSCLTSPTDILDYHIVDNLRSCEIGSELFRSDPHIHFHEYLDDTLPTQFDIVFMSGVLQYVENYSEVIETLSAYHPDYFLFTLTSAGDMPTFASGQMNLKGSILPAWFFNLREFVKMMADKGYSFVFKVGTEEKFDMSNFPEGYRFVHMANMLFRKAQEVPARSEADASE